MTNMDTTYFEIRNGWVSLDSTFVVYTWDLHELLFFWETNFFVIHAFNPFEDKARLFSLQSKERRKGGGVGKVE